MYPQIIQGFSIWGIVKETGIDDEGLIEFSKNYFYYNSHHTTNHAMDSNHNNIATSTSSTTFEDLNNLGQKACSAPTNHRPKRSGYPLYCDKLYTFYHALGDRKINLPLILLHPKYLRGIFCEIYSQWKDNNHKQQQQQQQRFQQQLQPIDGTTNSSTKENGKNEQATTILRTKDLVLRSSNSTIVSSSSHQNSKRSIGTDQPIAGRNDIPSSSGISFGSIAKGDGITQGGLIVFDGFTNLPIFVYEEETGYDIPFYELASFLIHYRQQRKQQM
jgi:hypothetical protein